MGVGTVGGQKQKTNQKTKTQNSKRGWERKQKATETLQQQGAGAPRSARAAMAPPPLTAAWVGHSFGAQTTTESSLLSLPLSLSSETIDGD